MANRRQYYNFEVTEEKINSCIIVSMIYLILFFVLSVRWCNSYEAGSRGSNSI